MIDQIVLCLVAIGALNWGLVGFFQFDLIAAISGGSTMVLARVLYAAVGLAGLWSLTFFTRLERHNPTRIT